MVCTVHILGKCNLKPRVAVGHASITTDQHHDDDHHDHDDQMMMILTMKDNFAKAIQTEGSGVAF